MPQEVTLAAQLHPSESASELTRDFSFEDLTDALLARRYVPSLPEIVTYGKDEREALAMAEDAIRLVLEDCAARGEPVPAGEPPRIREVTVTLAA